jgi:hypothetical protein
VLLSTVAGIGSDPAGDQPGFDQLHWKADTRYNLSGDRDAKGS